MVSGSRVACALPIARFCSRRSQNVIDESNKHYDSTSKLTRFNLRYNSDNMAAHPLGNSTSFYGGGVPLPDPFEFGGLCSANRKPHINAWLNAMPPKAEMEDVAASRALTSELYKDWLDWSMHTALTWLQKLDKLERYLRKSAVRYHKTPYKARHAKIHNNRKLDSMMLRRLSDILETNQPREQQSFFTPWFHIQMAVADILDELKDSEPMTDDISTLRQMERKFQLSLARMPLLYHTATEDLAWLRGAVRDVSQRAGIEDNDSLFKKYSRQGGLFRRWMLTLPEVANGRLGERAEDRANYIEWYVKELLESGVENDTYWSSYMM
jgi:hypothetical protein